MNEAFKGVVWCHGPTTTETGETLYRYVVVGLLVTNEPIAALEVGEGRDIESEAVLCGSSPGLAAVLERVEQGEVTRRLGDATDVLVSLSAIQRKGGE